MAMLIKFIVAIIVGITVLPWCAYLLADLWRNLPGWMPRQNSYATSGGLLVGVGLLWARRPQAYIHTLIHETCHAILCIVFFVKINSFKVTDGNGGCVGHERVDPFRATFISIAPYTLPLLLGMVLLSRQYLTLDKLWLQITGALAGFLLIHHYHAVYHNVRINISGKQSDLVKVGRPLSFVLIACGLLLTTYWWLRVMW